MDRSDADGMKSTLRTSVKYVESSAHRITQNVDTSASITSSAQLLLCQLERSQAHQRAEVIICSAVNTLPTSEVKTLSKRLFKNFVNVIDFLLYNFLLVHKYNFFYYLFQNVK
jgi:hypothetical protein